MQMTPLWMGSPQVGIRQHIELTSHWCSVSSLTLNVLKTKELISDFGKHQDHTHLWRINGEHVEILTTVRFLGIHSSDDLSWTRNTKALKKKAHQGLHFLHVLRKKHHFCVRSVLMYCLGIWYISPTAENRKAVQKVINTAQKIIGFPLLLPGGHIQNLLPQENQGTPHILPITCLTCYPPDRVSGQLNHTLPDSPTVFFPGSYKL